MNLLNNIIIVDGAMKFAADLKSVLLKYSKIQKVISTSILKEEYVRQR